jgi:NAD(P)-dependent dehydrogenase (short-subunit alcohol dehydrogenase family)
VGTAPAATPGIQQLLDPAAWRDHHFGLPPERWRALSGRTAWITGAGTGYGRCIAVALAAAGARVILSSRRAEKLNETIEEMRSLGVPADNASVITLDMTDRGSVEAAAAEVRQRVGSPHIVVHSAAISAGGLPPWPLTSMTLEQWNRIIDANVTGAWLICRAALPDMLAAGHCRLLLLTSEAGWAFTPGVGPYNVSKSALNNLGASLAAECAARDPTADVQINVLIPGEARTEMNKGSTVSPYTIVPMTLALLSHPAGGPNGRFFHRDGRHFQFAYAGTYEHVVI